MNTKCLYFITFIWKKENTKTYILSRIQTRYRNDTLMFVGRLIDLATLDDLYL